jgi:hypothetical protein
MTVDWGAIRWSCQARCKGAPPTEAFLIAHYAGLPVSPRALIVGRADEGDGTLWRVRDPVQGEINGIAAAHICCHILAPSQGFVNI